MDINELIVKTPGTCGGRARINGHRIPVSSVYRWFLSGLAPEDIVSKYEACSLVKVYAAVTYALANREEIVEQIAHEDQLFATTHEDSLSPQN